jgi:hypothetical protein|tara:strand:+ start:1543 stop:1764 length:222 start_codon:yes stop_codon:yes gene_type:complete
MAKWSEYMKDNGLFRKRTVEIAGYPMNSSSECHVKTVTLSAAPWEEADYNEVEDDGFITVYPSRKKRGVSKYQ